ncbi:MAG: hypothetical protein PVG14_15660 [Anaerolineales bacterium]|jgi:hypothetical protein
MSFVGPKEDRLVTSIGRVRLVLTGYPDGTYALEGTALLLDQKGELLERVHGEDDNMVAAGALTEQECVQLRALADTLRTRCEAAYLSP